MSSLLRTSLTFACLTLLAGTVRAETPAVTSIRVDPQQVVLSGPQPRFELLVDGMLPGGQITDLTHAAQYRSLAPEVCTVDARGRLLGLTDGETQIEVTVADQTQHVTVQVSGATQPRTFHFENDIVPVLSRFGCNTSGCHGKAEGQNGFKLSVFGFDPRADYVALTQEARGRRIFPADPAQSLFLTKASGGIPHGGGIRIARTSEAWETVHDWIAAGHPMGSADAPHVVSLAVQPRARPMTMLATQQLRVIATYSDGRTADVTRLAKFQTNNEGLGTVDDLGRVTIGQVPGQVAIMAAYMGAVDVFTALIPRAEAIAAYPALPEQNFIDGLVYQKLRTLNIVPSEPATDADFLRRVYLDIIGTLPTPAEARRFLLDTQPDRRARLVEELMQRPEFADYWALHWADLLRVDREVLKHRGAYSYYRWIRESFAANKPLDQFAREIITAEGPLSEAPGGHLFKVVTKPGDMASTISQVFLGVRLECAQCHHHPFDRWSQADYVGMQGFFSPVTFKRIAGEDTLLTSAGGSTPHPRTGEPIFPHALDTAAPTAALPVDGRQVLADWMTAPDNRWFARNLVNRTWAHFLGRGLIEPVDDVRLTNPATNPELLDALAAEFIRQKFDFRQLIRTITASQTYQLSSVPNDTNEGDAQNYSRALFKRMQAEVVFDAICQTTGIPEKFEGVPAGYRAIQLWDSKVPHYFLKLFGRPSRVTACECERSVEPSVGQVLHVLNSPEIHGKLSHEGGRLAELARTLTDDAQLVEELYLMFYARFPSEAERKGLVTYLQSHSTARRQAVEDIAWSMMNTVEFLFNH